MTPRICQVMFARGFGGAERLYVDLVLALAHAGHDVLAICEEGAVAWRRFEGSAVERVGIRARGWWDPVASYRLRRYIESYAADVVHTHLARATHVAARALRGRPVPLVASLHNYGKLKHYRGADVVVPTTHDEAVYFRGQGFPGERMRQIPNFSAIETVTGLPEQRNRPPVLLSYGRFVTKKGFAVLLRSLALLAGQGVDFTLRLGGDGPGRGDLSGLVDHLQLGSRVEWLGWVDDVSAELDRADIFVLPSLDEPFGIAVLEAMARGVPVVATRTQGPREILSRENSWLCVPGDVDDLAAALVQALEDEDRRRQKAAAALALFRQRYSSAAVVPQFAALYRELCG